MTTKGTERVVHLHAADNEKLAEVIAVIQVGPETMYGRPSDGQAPQCEGEIQEWWEGDAHKLWRALKGSLPMGTIIELLDMMLAEIPTQPDRDAARALWGNLSRAWTDPCPEELPPGTKVPENA